MEVGKFLKNNHNLLKGHFEGKDIDVGGEMLIGNEKSSYPDIEVLSLPSTAIADISYNPEEEVASVKFVGGDKTYDYSVSPEEFNDFMNAPSKGRHVAKLWNHNPEFHI